MPECVCGNAHIAQFQGVLRYFFSNMVFSERERSERERDRYMSSSVRLSSVTFVHPTQAIEIFGTVSMPFGTLAIFSPNSVAFRADCVKVVEDTRILSAAEM